MPEEWTSEIMNHIALDNLPEHEDYPTGAIVGYVDVYDFKQKTDSIWDGGEELTKWMLRDAWMFDEPILNVKGKLGLFDYPLDENNLPPAHKVVLNRPIVDGDEICFPVSQSVWDDIAGGAEAFYYDITDTDMDECVDYDKDGNYKLKSLKTIMFTREGKAMRFEITGETNIYAYSNKDDKPYVYTSVLDGNEYEWDFINFALGKKL